MWILVGREKQEYLLQYESINELQEITGRNTGADTSLQPGECQLSQLEVELNELWVNQGEQK